jgi:hypothetical protein
MGPPSRRPLMTSCNRWTTMSDALTSAEHNAMIEEDMHPIAEHVLEYLESQGIPSNIIDQIVKLIEDHCKAVYLRMSDGS